MATPRRACTIVAWATGQEIALPAVAVGGTVTGATGAEPVSSTAIPSASSGPYQPPLLPKRGSVSRWTASTGLITWYSPRSTSGAVQRLTDPRFGSSGGWYG